MNNTFLNTVKTFIKNTANDKRIPGRDKKMIIALVALILSPIDIIPDWIPVLGVMDDFIILALLLDYFFDVLDDKILLSNYPWGMKSFARFKRVAKMFSFYVPRILKNNLWKYTRDIYR